MPRDPRTYITVHDGLPEHPKVEGLSDAAFRLLITSWCYCSRNLTDGQIKAEAWKRRGTPKARAELIAEGLAEVTDAGVAMHDYTEHQRTAAEVEDLREKRVEAGRKGGIAKASKRIASANGFAKQTPSKLLSKALAESETDTEEVERSTSSGPRKRGARIKEDWLPSPSVRSEMATECPSVDLRSEHRKFIDHWMSASGANAAKLDWDRAWRNWIRNAAERTGSKPTAATPTYVETEAPDAESLPWARVS